MIVAYIVIFGTLSVLRHQNFQTQTWDMAIFDDIFRNTIIGHPMMSRFEEVKNHFGVHFSPFLLLLVPGYALFPSAYYLLIIQTIALALGAWPLYKIAKLKLQKERLAIIIACAYLLSPSLQAVNLFDFHPIAFLVPLLLAELYFLETKQWRWGSLFLLLSAGVQEDAILAVLFVGIYYLLVSARKGDGTEKKIAISIIVASFFYFFLAVKIIMPHFGGGLLRLDRYANLGKTPVEIITTVGQNPLLLFQTIVNKQKLAYLFWIFFPAAFLPLFSPLSFVPLIPGLAENLLTSYGFQFNSLYQYDAMIIPALFFSIICGLVVALKRFPHKEKIVERVFIATVLLTWFIRSPIGPVNFHWSLYGSSNRAVAFRQMLRDTSLNVSVSANTNLVPHLLDHAEAYMLGTEKTPVDVLLIDAADDTGFRDAAQFQSYVDQYARSGAYTAERIDAGGRYIILKKRGL